MCHLVFAGGPGIGILAIWAELSGFKRTLNIVGDGGGGYGFEKISPIASVPAPAALPLFATGLGLLGWLGFRRKRRAALAA